MPFTLTVDSFLACLATSGLLEEDRMGSLLLDLSKRGIDVANPRKIAEALVRDAALTNWQAENLLRGKRRGFVLGKYRLLSLLGRGGMNAVYLAEHSLMRRRCALKILPTKRLKDHSEIDRFHREAHAVASLQHSNIVRAYDIDMGLDGDVEIHFFVMEYVDGQSLQDRVERDGPLPIVDAANFIRQAAEGLAHAHSAGIVHRDVKPANLLVDRHGVVKILDLGLAKFFDAGSSTGAVDEKPVLGTADYVSPEQALDGRSTDARSDIYSLGCTFYFLLAGHPPFPEGTLNQRLVSHQFQQPTPIVQKRSDVPEELASILDRMLAKKPSDRVQTAEEVAELLRQWLVEHADRAWLQKNPAVLSGADTLQKAIALPREKVLAAAPSTSDSSLPEVDLLPFGTFDTEMSPVTRSMMERRPSGSTRLAMSVSRAWNDRRRRELLIACALFLAVCVVGLLGWLMLGSESTASPAATRAGGSSAGVELSTD